MVSYKQFKNRVPEGYYKVNVDWYDLEDTLKRWEQDDYICKLNKNPNFQRGHVWTKAQQIAYVEFKISGGTGSNIIHFNCPGWMHNFKGPFVLVDGLQRLTAVLRFIKGEIPAFGHYVSEFEQGLRFANADFIFCVNNLSKESEVLRWYIEMNSGGTPHTEEEIEKVRNLLKEKE